jgi:hypothetical protein
MNYSRKKKDSELDSGNYLRKVNGKEVNRKSHVPLWHDILYSLQYAFFSDSLEKSIEKKTL